jgi:hypothetical protein
LATRWLEEGQEFTQVIPSPQSRAHQTAEIIAEILTAPLEFDTNWKKIDNGMLAGLFQDDAASGTPFPNSKPPMSQSVAQARAIGICACLRAVFPRFS